MVKRKISETKTPSAASFLWQAAFYGFIGFFVLAALFSHHPGDPSVNLATDAPALNMMGKLGAALSDPLLQLFGVASYVVALGFLVWGLRSFYRQAQQRFISRFFAFLGALIATAGLCSLLPASDNWMYYVGLGGVLGDVLKQTAVDYIGVIAFAVLMSMLTALCLYIALDMRRDEIRSGWGAFAFLMIKIGASLAFISHKIASFLQRLTQRSETPDEATIVPVRQESASVPPQVAAPAPPKLVETREVKEKPKKPAKQAALALDSDGFSLPPLDVLMKADPSKKITLSESALEQNAKLLAQVLEDFGVQGNIIKVRPGPVVTLYELEPAPGTKSSRIISLADDIARSMSSVSARIATIPGRNVLGIELPNANRETVYLRELIETDEYTDERVSLPIALGKDIGGDSVMTDLARMPHLLIAGTTGSGKSVAVNAMILSFLYRLSPEECKFIMIDPKMLELSIYDGIPHLLSPVVTEPGKAVVALKWAVREMEERYRAMSNLGVRNIAGYNQRIDEAIKKGDVIERRAQTGYNPENGEPIYETVPLEMKKLPFIVIIVDEMADLMLTAGKDIEASIQRLAQMARAAGIHMVMATQRPSVDVITGVIKANFPTRISFQVTSRIDSRTILGEMGAEQLLGMGDMLYMAGGGRVTRVHGPFVDDNEVRDVVEYLKSQGEPDYLEEVTTDQGDDSGAGFESDSGDGLYDQAVSIVLRDKKVSTSYIQRQLRIGYNRAANIIDKMEDEGVISAPNHAGKREILVG